MPKIRVRRVDESQNSDMVMLLYRDDLVAAVCHMDIFWEGPTVSAEGEVFRRLRAGEELTLELTIVGAAEAPGDGGES